jgi:hypothetical protein
MAQITNNKNCIMQTKRENKSYLDPVIFLSLAGYGHENSVFNLSDPSRNIFEEMALFARTSCGLLALES